jgi:anti-sigma-K factor RskA
MAEWLMADAREASVLQAIDGSETVGNSAGSASAVATDAALAAAQRPSLRMSETPKVKVDGNTKPSVQQKKKGTRSLHKHNDYLTEELKEEVDKYSPNRKEIAMWNLDVSRKLDCSA